MFIKKLLSITPSEPSHMRCDFEDLFRKLNAEFYRRSGDSAFRKVFSTPTSVLGAPTGEMLMESLQSRSLLPKGPVTVFEIGPGNGDLATGVIRFLNRGLIGSRYIVGNFEGIDSATITGQETKTVAVSVTPFDASYCYEPQVKKKFPSKVDVVILNELLDDLPPTPVLWSKEESCFMAELTKGKFTKIEEGSDLHLTLACIPEPMRRQLVDTGVVFYLNPHFYHILKTAKDCLTPDGIIVVMDYFTISPPLSVRFYPAQTPTGIPYTPDTVQELCHDTIPPNITHNVWGPLLLKIGKEVGLRLTELTTMVTLIDQFDSAVDRLFGRDFRYRGEVYTQEELLAQEGFEFFSRFLSHSKLQSHHLSVLDLVIFLEMYSKMQKSFESELTSFLTGALTLTHFSFIIASNFFDDEACCGLIRPFQTLLEMVKAEKIDLGDPKYQVFLSRSSFNQIGWRVNTDHIAIIFRNSSSPTQVSPKTVFLTSSSLHNPAVPYLSSLKPDRTQMDLAQKDFHFTKLLMQAF